MKSIKAIVVITLFSILLGACNLRNAPLQPSLGETSWSLNKINEISPIEGSQVTLVFAEGSSNGNAGCNSYQGTYQAEGDRLQFGPLVQTEMACMEPLGVMDQERVYLQLLGAAQSYEVSDEVLTITSDNGQSLKFLAIPAGSSGQDLPSNDQSSVSQENPSITDEPAQPAEGFDPPADLKEYRDSITGIAIYIPEEWYIQNQNIIAGDYAIFSSYPPDKYTGGEARQPGDTKCDLNLNPEIDSIGTLVQQWQASPLTTILSEEEFVLNSGIPGTKFVIDSMGTSTILVTQINARFVIFSCWGDATRFNEISATLRASD